MAISEPAKNPVLYGKPGGPSANPIEAYDASDLINKIQAAQQVLEEKLQAFLAKANADERLVDNFNVNEEWRCWLERDTESSKLLYDAELSSFDEEARDCFKEHYADELDAILAESDAIDKMALALDEFQLFKTSLYNVFNNGADLPLHLYLEQVFNRAKDFGMTVKRHSREDMDLLVSFDPLGSINRGDAFFSYDFYMRFNHNYKKECHMYSVSMMDANSSETMFSGPVDLPIYGAYAKFSKDTDQYFFQDHSSIFYQQSLKAHRKKEKAKFGIPADYFEGTFMDRKKLVDFSEKSYQYGNSKIFVPKSQVAFAGDKVYMKRWLYAKLKKRVEQYEAAHKGDRKPSLREKVNGAEDQAASAHSRNGKSVTTPNLGR